jgi:hypothetical protein
MTEVTRTLKRRAALGYKTKNSRQKLHMYIDVKIWVKLSFSFGITWEPLHKEFRIIKFLEAISFS